MPVPDDLDPEEMIVVAELERLRKLANLLAQAVRVGERQAVASLYTSGHKQYKIERISDVTGLSTRDIYRHITESGVSRRRRSRKNRDHAARGDGENSGTQGDRVGATVVPLRQA